MLKLNNMEIIFLYSGSIKYLQTSNTCRNLVISGVSHVNNIHTRNSRQDELIKTLKSNGRALIQIRPCTIEGGGGFSLRTLWNRGSRFYDCVSPV